MAANNQQFWIGRRRRPADADVNTCAASFRSMKRALSAAQRAGNDARVADLRAQIARCFYPAAAKQPNAAFALCGAGDACDLRRMDRQLSGAVQLTGDATLGRAAVLLNRTRPRYASAQHYADDDTRANAFKLLIAELVLKAVFFVCSQAQQLGAAAFTAAARQQLTAEHVRMLRLYVDSAPVEVPAPNRELRYPDDGDFIDAVYALYTRLDNTLRTTRARDMTPIEGSPTGADDLARIAAACADQALGDDDPMIGLPPVPDEDEPDDLLPDLPPFNPNPVIDEALANLPPLIEPGAAADAGDLLEGLPPLPDDAGDLLEGLPPVQEFELLGDDDDRDEEFLRQLAEADRAAEEFLGEFV